MNETDEEKQIRELKNRVAILEAEMKVLKQRIAAFDGVTEKHLIEGVILDSPKGRRIQGW